MADNLGYDPTKFRPDAKGTLHLIEAIKPEHQLEDDIALEIAERARAISVQLAEFRAWAMGEGDAFVDTLREKYGAKRGGSKGGYQIVAFDGSVRILFTVQDRIEFGAELQVAKDLIDECIREWSAGANTHLVTIVQDAFKVDRKGQVSTDRILGLRRHAIDHPTWRRAMEAIADSVRRDCSKRYVRVQIRDRDGAYVTLPLDVASAEKPAPVPAANLGAADLGAADLGAAG